jgi:hypothetical protein
MSQLIKSISDWWFCFQWRRQMRKDKRAGRILKSRKGDEGLYQHELTHVKQAFLGLFIVHALLYKFLPEYRLWAEVQAFKKQAEYYPDDRIPLFAAAIATRYNLKISKENAEKLLRE